MSWHYPTCTSAAFGLHGQPGFPVHTNERPLARLCVLTTPSAQRQTSARTPPCSADCGRYIVAFPCLTHHTVRYWTTCLANMAPMARHLPCHLHHHPPCPAPPSATRVTADLHTSVWVHELPSIGFGKMLFRHCCLLSEALVTSFPGCKPIRLRWLPLLVLVPSFSTHITHSSLPVVYINRSVDPSQVVRHLHLSLSLYRAA
ncbi:hypothetical protein F5B21DRAFT_172078 [Xylaria acuta]|nr:hypothetical protein F5B21DRAFT_172078 [Xylaria acuta]